MTAPRTRSIPWGRVVAIGLLGLAIGLAGWVRFGYERAPDPQRVTVVARSLDVAFVLERTAGDPVAGYELVGDGFTQRADGVWEADRPGARITYSGSVGGRALVRFDSGPDGGRAVVRTAAGPVARVDLSADEPGTEVVAVDTPLRLQPANILLLVLSIGIGVLLALLVVRIVAAMVRRVGVGRAVGGLAGLVFVAAVVVVWWLPAPRIMQADVTVTHPAGSAAVAVGLERAGGVPRSALADDFGGPGWTMVGRRSVSTEPGAQTRWAGMVSPDDTLELSGDGPGARALEVEVDGVSRRVVLGDDRRASVSFADLGAGAGVTDGAMRVAALLGDVLLVAVGLLLLAAGAFLIVRRVRGGRRPTVPHPSTGGDASWRLTWGLASVPLIGWLVLLAVFWPGPMNPDAMSQWFQVQDDVLADWHPYLLALLFAGTRAIVDSPWLPILLVVGTAALLAGRVGAWSVARGRSVGQTAGWMLLLVAVPATALHTVTLWKDSFYGIGLLGLVLCLWRVEDTRGLWLDRTRNVVLLVIAGAGTWLVLIALLAHRAQWRRFVVIAAAIVVIVGVVQVPLARILDVGPNPVDDIVVVQHISMHLAEGTDLTASERRLLEELRPLDEPWPYLCSSIQATWSGPDVIPMDRYLDRASELRSLALRLALRNPGAELRHLACASKIVWQPWSSGTTTYFMEWYDNGGRIDYLPVWLLRSPMEEPGNTGLAVAVFRLVDRAPDWLVRPALYLWVLVAAIVVSVRRSRSWAPLRMTSPVLIQSVALAAVNLVQDVRFQYGVVLVAVLMAPLLFTVRRDDDPEGPPLVWAAWPSGLSDSAPLTAAGTSEAPVQAGSITPGG